MLKEAMDHGYKIAVLKILKKHFTYLSISPVEILGWACENGHLEVAKLLLERGADPTAKDRRGFNCIDLYVRNHGLSKKRNTPEHMKKIQFMKTAIKEYQQQKQTSTSTTAAERGKKRSLKESGPLVLDNESQISNKKQKTSHDSPT